MAEDRNPGGFFERLQMYRDLRANGAWDHLLKLPTRDDYAAWLVIDTEAPVPGYSPPEVVEAFYAEEQEPMSAADVDNWEHPYHESEEIEDSSDSWADYYRARLAYVKEQVQLGLPLDDPEGRQTVLDFAKQWKQERRTDERSWSLAEMQDRMQRLTQGKAGVEQHQDEGMGY